MGQSQTLKKVHLHLFRRLPMIYLKIFFPLSIQTVIKMNVDKRSIKEV